jgi:hypothetical protein
MSVSTSARASQVARNIKSGSYIGMKRFAGYNEATEGIVAQQREADLRVKQIQAQRALRLKKSVG